MKLKNKVIVITGASQGLGREIAIQAASFGAKVALVSRNEKLLQEVKLEIEKNEGIAEYFICDISKKSQITNVKTRILEKFKSIDVLINNAGIWTDEETEVKNPERRKQAFEINSYGHIEFTYAFLPVLKKQKSGHIFNVISSAGKEQEMNVNFKAYSASKWAMTGFTKALQKDSAQTQIKVTGFYPGGMNTNLFLNSGRKNSVNQPWMMDIKDISEIIIFTLTRPKDICITELSISKKTVD